VLLLSSHSYAQNSPPQLSNKIFVDKTFVQNITVTVLSALLSFFSGYFLSRLQSNQTITKRISYSRDIEKGIVNIAKNIQNKVKVLYENQEIQNLYSVKFNLENTGSTVIKLQEIRFEFSGKTRILDFRFNAESSPEMQISEVQEANLRNFERKIRIGHMEKEQSLEIEFTVTCQDELEITPHPYNPEGNVQFISRSASNPSC